MFGFVDLPASVELGITAAITAGFYLFIRFVVSYVPWLEGFLAKYAAEWALALSVAFIGWLENALPSGYPDIAILAVQLVLAVLAAIGFGVKLLAARKVKGFAKE